MTSGRRNREGGSSKTSVKRKKEKGNIKRNLYGGETGWGERRGKKRKGRREKAGKMGHVVENSKRGHRGIKGREGGR